MMGLTNHLRIFLALEPCDMRKSFNGLTALAELPHIAWLESDVDFEAAVESEHGVPGLREGFDKFGYERSLRC